jgi:hypothetical protein
MDYSSKNYGANALCVSIGIIDLYFSYQTVVAFRSPEDGLVVSENVWTVTTGKHLNSIQPDKSCRIDYGEFSIKLNNMLENYKLNKPEIR